MHPYMAQELTKIKIAEELKYAEQQRLARLAASNRRHHWIDFSSLGQRLRTRLSGGTALGGTPAGAGA